MVRTFGCPRVAQYPLIIRESSSSTGCFKILIWKHTLHTRGILGDKSEFHHFTCKQVRTLIIGFGRNSARVQKCEYREQEFNSEVESSTVYSAF